jgi:serine/threonine protein kinase
VADNTPEQVTENVVIGGYRLKRHMWSGMESQVWEVVEPASGRHFAMKILLQEKAHDGDARATLFHEAEMGQFLAQPNPHPNIVKVVSVRKDKATPHYVMEFFPAGALKMRLMHWVKERDFIIEHAHEVLKQLATAMAYIHSKGLVHRDIKPENMLVNGVGHMKLIDFGLMEKIPTGLAKMFYVRPRVKAGSRSYMSPEQIRGDALDGRADMYSFACTAYEIVTSRPPFRGASVADILNKHLNEKPLSPCIHNPDVTKEFGDLLLKLLAKKKQDRLENFHQVLMALRPLRIFKSAEFKPRNPDKPAANKPPPEEPPAEEEATD